VAWVFDAKGCSNIWVADPSHGAKARQITPYTEDDGFDIGELAWSPDTKSIAFTRGQSLEDETPANVNNSPKGPMPKEVWVVATAGGVPHKVGAGDSPSFSPDGSRLLFVDKKRIQTVAASGDGDAQPLLIDQGTVDSLLVQPDDDSVVPFQQAAELIEGLRSHNIDHDVIMIPNEIHDMARYSSWMMLFNAADVYFDRHLDKRSAPAP
jgi:dipeptidyl aminopeptidase/acylaminoacyl peptidase